MGEHCEQVIVLIGANSACAPALQGELLDILQEQNDIAAHSVVELLVAESRAVENATKCFLTLSLYNIKVDGIADPKQRCVFDALAAPATHTNRKPDP